MNAVVAEQGLLWPMCVTKKTWSCV